MRKIFLVILLFCGLNAFAQDTLELFEACKMVDINLLKVKNIKDKEVQRDSFLLCFNQFLAIVENNANSFSYNFDYLKTIKVCTSSDNKLRFFSSLLVDIDNNVEYFAKILKKNDDNQNIFVNLPSNWYPAIYYQIANVGGKKTPVYVACGSQLGNDFVNRKVLEQFVFQGDNIIFGGNFIDEKKVRQERLVFEYNKHSAMTLFVDSKAKTVILDHLSPSNPKFKGNNMFYGSDFSFDGYYFNGQSWEYIPDIDYKQGK